MSVIRVSSNTYLRRLYEDTEITVDPSDGITTFASSGFFLGGVNGSPPRGPQMAMNEMDALVFEQIRNGSFAAILRSLGEGRRRWQEAQAVALCFRHVEKLRQGGFGNFFELEGNVVARVALINQEKFRVDFFPFDYPNTWWCHGRPRFFV